MPIVGIASARADRGSHRRGDRLEHPAPRPLPSLECERRVQQRQRRGRVAPLRAEPTQPCRRLRRQPDMTHHRDVRLRDRTDAHGHPAGPLELHEVDAALLDHADRAGHGLLVRELVAAKRQVTDHERVARRARDRAGQHQHLVEADRHRRVVPEHHHRAAVSPTRRISSTPAASARRAEGAS